MKSQLYLIALRKKLPPFPEISSFYATIVFLVYSWTSLTFFWKLPSWLFFLSLGDIIVVLAYVLVSTFLESLTILFIFLMASLVLPAPWLRQRFILRGSLIFYVLTFWVALLNLNSLISLPTSEDLFAFAIGFPLTAGLGILLADRIPSVGRWLTLFSNRLTIFLYLWLPLSLIGILIVLLRII